MRGKGVCVGCIPEGLDISKLDCLYVIGKGENEGIVKYINKSSAKAAKEEFPDNNLDFVICTKADSKDWKDKVLIEGGKLELIEPKKEVTVAKKRKGAKKKKRY